MSYTAAAKMKRLRGAVLTLLRTRHDNRESKMDSTALASALVRGLGFDVSRNEVKTVLEDLCDRGYVSYKEVVPDKESGAVYIVHVQLSSRGRDLLEETITDPAVEI